MDFIAADEVRDLLLNGILYALFSSDTSVYIILVSFYL